MRPSDCVDVVTDDRHSLKVNSKVPQTPCQEMGVCVLNLALDQVVGLVLYWWSHFYLTLQDLVPNDNQAGSLSLSRAHESSICQGQPLKQRHGDVAVLCQWPTFCNPDFLCRHRASAAHSLTPKGRPQ